MAQGNGPYETSAEALAEPLVRDTYAVMRHGNRGLGTHENRRRLLAACEDAGVELGEYDRRILHVLAAFEPEAVQSFIGILSRAGGGR